MTDSVKNNEKRLRIELRGMTDAYRDLHSKDLDEEAAHLAWSAFLKHFKLASSLVIRLAKSNRTTEGIARTAECARKSDPILKYLIKARNHDEHPEDLNRLDLLLGSMSGPTAGFPARGRLGPFGGILGPGGTVSMHNVRIDGHDVSGAVYWDGQPAEPVILGNIPAVVYEGGFEPGAVSDRAGKAIAPPCGRPGDTRALSLQFAEHAKNWLDKTIAQIEATK